MSHEAAANSETISPLFALLMHQVTCLLFFTCLQCKYSQTSVTCVFLSTLLSEGFLNQFISK